MTPRKKKAAPKAASPPLEFWNLTLYVAGRTPKSVAARENLQRLCEAYLQGRYEIEIIDLLKNPKLARDHQIIAIPTMVRRLPKPIRKIIGDLSDTERTLVGLQIQATRS